MIPSESSSEVFHTNQLHLEADSAEDMRPLLVVCGDSLLS